MSGRIFSGRLKPEFNPFHDNYLAEIFQATAIAWARMQHPIGNEIEDKITFRLAGRLANDAHFAGLPYDVVPQSWLLGVNGERLGRLDLRFKHRKSQRDYFAFESKRLHVTYPGGAFSTEYPTYVGEDGMMAFVNGQYSQGLPASGMLRYVMDGKADGAWSGLGRRIGAQRNSLKLLAGSALSESTLSSAIAKGIVGAYLGETDHDLGSHPLRIFHLLLPVRCEDKAAGRVASRLSRSPLER